MVACPLRLMAVAAAALLLLVGAASGDVTSAPSTASPLNATSAPATSAPATSFAPLKRHNRAASRDIQRFRSYKDVSMLPFHIPERVRFASFNFTVAENAMSALTMKCSPRKVTIVLKFGSYPVINPDGARFPDHYETRRLPYYETEFDSDGKPRTINVTNPLPGDWYAVAFLSYTDPNDDKILQQGLTASCYAVLEAALDISEPEDVSKLSEGVATPVRTEGSDAEKLWSDFRAYVPGKIRATRIELLVSTCSKSRCPTMTIYARSHAFPNSNETVGRNDTVSFTCAGNDIQRGDDCVMTVAAEEDAWLFISVEVAPDPKSVGKNIQVGYAINVTFEAESNPESEECNALEGECWTRVPLTRQSYVALFMYNYVRTLDPAVQTSPAEELKVNLSTSSMTLLEFPVFPVTDVGGTLTFELRLDQTKALVNATGIDVGVDSNIDTSKAPTAASTAIQKVNVSVIACLSFSSKRIPVFPDTCQDVTTERKYPSSIRVNSTTRSSFTGKVHLPFPEPGRWYLSFRFFCFTSGNESESLVDCGDLNETQISFVLDSESCGADRCGDWGHCNNYLSGGIIFATCVCLHGYRGWGCTDDRWIEQFQELLLAVLLLTLSNLPFLLATFVAIRRRYYTEALVYFCTFFFSTFYHACDAGEDVYSYCIMQLHVLQFCDFYSAILALWVTLIAMADLAPTPRSLLHMGGAVGIALGTEYDRTSLSVFLIPTLVGVALVGARWSMRCRVQRSCYPHKNYWKFFVPPGAVLVIVGIICYSYLQTRSNYKYVHSAWHSMMAFAIIIILPSRNHSAFESVESDDSVDSATPFWKRAERWCFQITSCR